ncbi:DUF6445 family protein [Shewanella donghaensis]|uniref:DUF6445 family protein n=1 Tax=Shewanella donghaensis TaxID=238836 RepID=UPI0011827947|nr:DUF6445 family protein [Shewanella donghaensis]
MFSINPNIKPCVEYVGNSRIPIVIIDDYMADIALVRDVIIASANFTQDKHTQYPGIRSAMSKVDVVSYLKPLMLPLYKVFNFPRELTPSPRDNYYSLLTTQEADLSLIQTIPHFDTYQPNLIACIHYLSQYQHGGTAFYRHKSSGYEFINEVRLHEYQTTVNGLSNSGYCGEHHPDFECYKVIPYQENRLIIFSGQLLHSSLVNPELDINDNPMTGRLTANLFIKFN